MAGKKVFLASIFILCYSIIILFSPEIKSQTKFNFNFELLNSSGVQPEGLSLFGSKEYILLADSNTKQNGKYSLYLESPTKLQSSPFASYGFMIPADYKGSEIRLKGFIKTEDINQPSFAGLILKLYGENDKLINAANLGSEGVRGSNDWCAHAVSLPFTDEVRKISAGVTLFGKGKAWFDNLQLFIDDKEISTIPTIKKKIPGAELDSAFNQGSEIIINDLNSDKIDNLALLGKLWGFLKYFHPSVAKGNYNWDFELFRIIPKIINCIDKEERSRVLLNWIDTLGKTEKCENCSKVNMENVKMLPDLKWLKDEKIMNKKLIQRLEYIKNNRNRGEQYYVSLAPGVLNPNFKNEREYPKMKYDDQGYLLLSLFRYWNMIQYFFPYKYAIDENWNNVLREFIPKFINSKDELSYKLNLLELIARIHDTHAQIYSRDQAILNYTGQYYPFFNIRFIEGKPVVTGFLNDDYAKDTTLKIGDVISKIDGIDVNEIIKEKLPFTSGSNEPVKLRGISRDLLKGKDKYVKIEYIRDGKKYDAEIERINYAFLALDLISKKKDTCYKFIKAPRLARDLVEDSTWRNLKEKNYLNRVEASEEENIGYIYSGTIRTEYLPKMMESFKNTKGIVIDLRCYPSEFIVYSLSEYLMPGYTDFVKFTRPTLEYPGLFQWTPGTMVGRKNKEYYKGKIVILINEETQSQAEFTTMAFRVAPKSTVIGSTTSGADGNVSFLDLPGGVKTGISGIGVYYPDGRETQRVGIIPDIEVKPTIKGIREKRDELLEKAIEIIEKSK